MSVEVFEQNRELMHAYQKLYETSGNGEKRKIY